LVKREKYGELKRMAEDRDIWKRLIVNLRIEEDK
jgi:hypothetical protein